MDALQINFEKIKLIIELAGPIIERRGSYKIINEMTQAEEVEISKHYSIKYLYSLGTNRAYMLTHKI